MQQDHHAYAVSYAFPLRHCCSQRLDTGTNVLSSHTELPFLVNVSIFRKHQMVVSNYHLTWVSVYVLQFQNHSRCIICLEGTNRTQELIFAS